MGRWLLTALLVTAAADAAEIEGTVHLRPAAAADPPGLPAEPIVVYVTGFSEPPPAGKVVIAQRDKTFVPHFQVIVAGQSIQFTNEDPFVHNVFSTSRARPFDLGKPRPGQTREVMFPQPGLIDVYCNIHESMWATVLVLPNRAFALADGQGHFSIRGLRPGRYPLHAWGRGVEPYETEVTVSADRPAHVVMSVTSHPFNPGHLDKFGRPYRSQPEYRP